VQHIHEAPLTPDGWTRALSSIAGTLLSERGILLVQNARRATEFAVGFEITSEQAAGFEAAADADTALWGTVRALPVGSVVPSSALLPDREYARTILYNEGIRPLGVFHGLLVSPLSTPQRFVHLSTGRRLSHQDYDAEDIAVMRTMLPHLVMALRVKGDGRDASAARLGIATTTVRAHLSHIFEKTGVRRQAELVRLLMQAER